MNIVGKIVVLRAIEKEDLEVMRKMLNDPDIEDKVVGWSLPVSKYQQETWYENNIADQKNNRFIIDYDNEAIGIATLVNIDWKNRKATHGIKIIKGNFRGKGIGTDVVMALMRYAFDELQLNRLEGSWYKENVASINLYTKCGWVEEGIQRKSYFKKGKYRDLHIAAILAEDYHALVEEKKYWSVNE